jgi:hypothetical protein
MIADTGTNKERVFSIHQQLRHRRLGFHEIQIPE